MNTQEMIKAKVKSYWDRPGGKVGTIIGAGILALIGFKFYTAVLPTLLKLFDDTTELAFGITKAVVAMSVCGLVGFGFIYAIMSPRFRAGVGYLYQKFLINWWLQWLITIDPVMIAQGRIDEFEQEREEFRKKSSDISSSLIAVNRDIEKIRNEIDDNKKKAAVVTDLRMAGNLARQVGRLEEWFKKLIPLREGLKKAVEVCDKIYENSGYSLEDMKNEFQYKVREYESTKRASSALNTALGMFSGKSAKAKLGEEAMLVMEQSISDSLGSMRNDLRSVEKFISSIDLENQVYEADGLEMIKQLNPEIYKTMTVNGIPEPVKITVGDPSQSSRFDNLIK